MSSTEKSVFKWFMSIVVGVAIVLIAAAIMNMFSLSKAQDVYQTNLENQKEMYEQQLNDYKSLITQQFKNQTTITNNIIASIQDVKETHTQDVNQIRSEISILQGDVKQLIQKR